MLHALSHFLRADEQSGMAEPELPGWGTDCVPLAITLPPTDGCCDPQRTEEFTEAWRLSVSSTVSAKT